MKFLAVFLAIIALASAQNFQGRAIQGRSISSKLIEALEKLRLQMPCGFPKFGVPPLAPLKIEHKELAIKTDTISVDGEVDKARVDGLDGYIIENLKVNAILSKVTFRFRFPSILIKSLYDLETIAKAFGFTVDIKGKGNFYLDLQDIIIVGEIKYSILGVLKLKTLKITVSIGGVVSNIDGIFGQGLGNKKLNELCEEMIMMAVNDNQEQITQSIEKMVVPHVNEALDGKTLADIIASIGGGGGGSEPTVCVPPVDNE